MKLLLFAIAFIASLSTTAQAVIANEKMNVAYVGVDNPLSVAASGYPCSSVVLTTDNGKMEKVGCGRFIYKPKEVKETKIKVWVKNGRHLKFMNQWSYRVRPLPLPVATLHVWDNEGRSRVWVKDTVYKSFVLAAMSGITARLRDTDYDVIFQIISYTIIGERSKTELFKKENSGSIIAYQAAAPLEQLQSGDHLIFSNIKCIGPDGQVRIIAPMEFTITE